MHAEVTEFLRRSESVVPWKDAHVVEVGAADNNGATRDQLSAPVWASWCGIDLLDHPDVSYVGDAVLVLRTLVADGESWDVAVSTEVLEHAAEWQQIVHAMLDAVPNGWLVVTCAGTGRDPHAADGSPGGPPPGEHYANVSLRALAECVEQYGAVVVHGEEGPPGDTRLIARNGYDHQA